jgi:hypothetical protein
MKTTTKKIVNLSMALGLTVITALCLAPPARAASHAAPGQSKPSHGGGGGGGSGGSGGGTPGGSFYSTVSNVTQLINDINYADIVGGAFTINLQPNTTFDLVTNYTCDAVGCSLLPIIGGTKAVNLSIIGNGSTIQRDATNGNSHEIRLCEVAPGSSLTLDHMTLKNGYSYAQNGGAIYNGGTLRISNCTLSDNTAYYSGYVATLLGGKGGAIYNNAGTLVINSSILSGNLATGAFAYGGAIYNYFGTVSISNSALSRNSALSFVTDDAATLSMGGAIYNDSGAVTISGSSVTSNGSLDGGGIYNHGTVTVENSSSVTGNSAGALGPDVDNDGSLYLDSTSAIGFLYGNPATPF